MICCHCEEEVGPDEPQAPLNNGAILMHRECLLRQTVGSVGHILRRCSCHGGTLEDPVDMTRREAASAAAYLWTLLYKWGIS